MEEEYQYNIEKIYSLLEEQNVKDLFFETSQWYSWYSDYSWNKPKKRDTPVYILVDKIEDEEMGLVSGIMLGYKYQKTNQAKPWRFVEEQQDDDSCDEEDNKKEKERIEDYIKLVWCREVVMVKDLKQVTDLDDNQIYSYIEKIQNKDFLKISSDRQFTYGDGGECKLIKPLYFSEKLKIEENQRLRLKQLLNQLGEKTQDFHETCPVQDIVDPELMPNYSQQISKSQYELYSDDSSQEDYGLDTNIQPQSIQNNQYVSLRSQYQWIPTWFKIYKDQRVEIQGEIHNLPKKDNQELYELIVLTFQKQLPAYKKLNLLQFGEKDYCLLQVVFKAQKYVIPPGQKYSGKWHLEGKTENIVAAGVYYISIDQGFGHDQLQYRPLVSFSPHYYRGPSELSEHSRQWFIDIKEGCSLVFSNTLPHRFDTLTNETNKTLERLFINFFIVDPSKPLKDKEQINRIQNTIALKSNQNIAKIIMQYLGYEYDIEKGKEKRKIIRENSHKEVSGWGFVCYGNSGDVEFIDSFAINPKKGNELYGLKSDFSDD